jgi:hypothetical protein
LQRIGHIGLGHGNRVALLPLSQLQPLAQLLFKIAIAHLLEDVGVYDCSHLYSGLSWASEFS